MSDFKVYNNCLISALAPHKVPNVSKINEEIKNNNCLLARWTDNFDCPNETQWYYVIKDDVWDISKLKAKDRNVITKGLKNYDCKIINPKDYTDEIYNIYLEMNKILPESSRSNISKDDYCNFDKKDIFIAAFSKTTGKICGYARLSEYDDYKKALNFEVLRYLPEERNNNINASIIDYILNYFINEKKYEYICDGEKSIRHDTTFQNYLIRYFGFRKVFCNLHVVYSKKIKIIVSILYPLRNIIKHFSSIRLFHNIYGVLIQEKIVRSFK